jgi:Zn-dependent peptidase ImmA (M78 family)
VHRSHAGFSSDDRYELEAEHFAAALLMPDDFVPRRPVARRRGFDATESLSTLCVTSLTATATIGAGQQIRARHASRVAVL